MPRPLSHAPMSPQGDACALRRIIHRMPLMSLPSVGARHASPSLTCANVTAGRRMPPTKNHPPHAPDESPFRRGEACLALSHMHQCHCRATHASPLRSIIHRMPLMSLPSVGARHASPSLTCANVTAGRRMRPAKNHPPHAPDESPFRRGEARLALLSHAPMSLQGDDACVAPTKNPRRI